MEKRCAVALTRVMVADFNRVMPAG